MSRRPNLADPANEPTQRDWQRLAARAMKGVNERRAKALLQMNERLDAEIAAVRARSNPSQAA